MSAQLIARCPITTPAIREPHKRPLTPFSPRLSHSPADQPKAAHGQLWGFCRPMMNALPLGSITLNRGSARSFCQNSSVVSFLGEGAGASALGVIGTGGCFGWLTAASLSLPLRVAQPSSGPALTQKPPKWHVFYNIFLLTLDQRMRNVFKGRHGLRVKAKLEAAFG
jgi:hypothetical protein